MVDAGRREPGPGRRFGRGSRSPGEDEGGERQGPGWANDADAAGPSADDGDASPSKAPNNVTAALNRLREAAAAHDES
jgi:hypothetical protein